MTMALAVAGLVLLPVPPALAKATLFTWTGAAATKNWSIPQNWQGGVAPSGSASIYIPGGSGTMTNDLAPASVTLDQLTVEGTWVIQGNQIRVATEIYVWQGSTVDFKGGLAGGTNLDLDIGTSQAFTTTATISGPLDVSGRLRIDGWANDVSKVFIKGTTDNHVDVLQASRTSVTLDKPAGVQAARRVNAYFGSIVTWNADRQLNDPVAVSPTAPEFTQPMIDAEGGGQALLNGHTEVVNKLYVDGGGKVDLGTTGDLTAEAIRTGFANAGRSDITNGTFRLSAPAYDSANTVSFGNGGTDATDLHLDSKLLGSGSLRVDGASDRIPLLRLAKANQYTGALSVRFGTVCAALGVGGTVTEDGGVYIDERNETCVARAPTIRPSPPRSFSAQPGDQQVDLSWVAPANPGSAPLLGYHISRAIGLNEGGLVATLGPDATSWNDGELTNGTSYTYTISAYSSAGESDNVSLTTSPNAAPIPPGPPTLTALPGDASARLEWTTPADPGNESITEYTLYRYTDLDADGGGNPVYVGPDRAYLDTGLDNGTTYYYTVAARTLNTFGEASEPVSVTPSSDAGAISLSMKQLTPAYPGRTTTLQMIATNKSAQQLDGPVVATVILPASTFGIASSGGGGWTCGAPRALSGRSLVTCTNPASVAAMADVIPLELILSVPQGTARATYPVSYSIAAQGRAASSNQPLQIVVADPKPAHLALTVGAPQTLTADPQDMSIALKNDGAGSTLGPLTVKLTVPAGVTVDNLRTDPFWTCSLAAIVTCTTSQPLGGTSVAPPILLAAKAVATAELTTYLLRATANGSDALRSIAASASARVAGPVLPQPAFSVTPSAEDDGIFRLTVENTGGAAATGKVVVPLHLPSNYITVEQLGDFGAWSCQTVASINFVCTTADAVTLAPGDTLDGPRMSATALIRPPGSPDAPFVTLTGNYAASAYAQLTVTGGKTYRSPSTPVPLPVFAPQPPPTITTQAEFKDSPLYGQHKSSITFALKGHPNIAYTDRAPFVLLLPPSLVLDGTAIPSLAGYPAGTPAPSCEIRSGTYAGGFTKAVVCLLDRPAPAGSGVYVNVPFTAVPEIGGTVKALTGVVRRPSGITTPAAILDYVWARVASRGSAALAGATTASVNGITFNASAGPPQRVDAGVLAQDGTLKPTRVALKGSSSVETALPLNFGWVQTAGPKVTWLPPPAHSGGPSGGGTPPAFPPGYSFPGGAATQPDVFGKTPAFNAPLVTEHTEFVFQLYVTDGKAVATSVTTVAIDPLADNPPSVTSVVLTNDAGTVLNPAVAPAAGQDLQLRYTTADAEHDPVAVVPHVVRPGELSTLTFTPVDGAPAGQSWFAFRWPEGVPQVVVEALLTDGKTDAGGNAVASRHSQVIGPDPAPLGIGLAPPTTGIDPGGSLSLTATLTNPVVGSDSTIVTWTQLSGPPSTLTPSGSTVQLRAPPTAKPGDSIKVQALARRGTGSTAPVAVATVTIAVVALPTLNLGPIRTTGGPLPASVPTGSTTPLTIAVSGGRAPYTYAWQVVSGGGSLSGATTPTATLTAPGTPGLTTVAVDVTDAGGATVRQVGAVPVGTLTAGTAGAQGCDPGGPLRTIFDAAAGLADSDHVVVKFGALNVDLGTKGTLLGGATTCQTQTFPISGGSATVSGIAFAGISGSVNALGITISSATVTLPAAWRLTGVQLTDVRFGFTDYAFTGTLTASSLPVVASTGAVTQATTTLTFGVGRVTLVASARLAGVPVSFAGLYCYAGGPACTGPPAGVVGPVPSGALAMHATAGNLQFLDHTLTGGGDLTLAADGTLTGQVELSWTGAASGELGINQVSIRWNNVGLKFHAGANLGGRFAASLDGDYLDGDDWSANVSGGLVADWTPAPGLTLARYNSGTGTGTGVDGSVAMKAGSLSWAVTLRTGGVWSTGPLTIRGVSLTLGSGTAAPAGCRLTAAQQQNLYLDVKGIAEISWGASGGSGGTKVALNVETCIVPDVGWTLTTTAALSGVQITNGLDLTGVTFTAAHRNSPDQTSYVLNATGNAFGVSGAVTLALISPAVGDSSFLADMMVDLDDLGLPVSGEGHLLYASRPISDLGAIPGLDAGFATHASPTAPGAGACGGATPASPLAGLPVSAGFTALANFKMPTSLCGFLKDKVGVPVASSLVVSVNMSGTPVITASISAGPNGHQIFATDDGTKLSLKRIKLSISLGGSFGLMADADLTLAKPTATSPTDVSVLELSAGVTIQLAGVPSITVVLQKTGDAWEDAFGVNGLDLGDLAIQGGIVFSAIPTPSIGFGAQILDMPTGWKNTLGIIPTASGAMEPVQLVLNISLSNPILDITLGTANDNHDFMRPLRPISTSIENALRIDYAQLVIAPFGGDVGPYHYQPGFHLGFAMTVINTKIAVRADVDIASGTMGAHGEVGAMTFGPVSLDATTFDLALSPSNGGLTVEFNSGFRVGAIRTTARASVQARVAGSTPVLKVDFEASLNNVNLGPITLNQMKVFIHTNLSGPAAIVSPLAEVKIGATAGLTVLTVPMTVYGTVSLSVYGGVTGGDLLVTTGAFSVGPATVGGTGCLASVLGYLPAGVVVPTNGPCLQVGIHPGTSNPYLIKASGSLSVAGLSAKFDGQVDSAGVFINEARVQVGPVATVSLSGRLWAGPGVNGRVDYNPVTGTNVLVHNGDFRVHGRSSVKLAAFNGSLDFEFGNIGGTQFVIGRADMDVLKGGPLSFAASLRGSFSRTGSTFNWDLAATGTFYVAGYKVINADVHFTPTLFKVHGSLATGPINALVDASLYMSNGVRFNFTGSGSINVIGLGIGASVTIGNTTGPLIISASANVDTSVLHVHAQAWFSTSGGICLWGSANVGSGNSSWPDLVNGSASFCTQSMNGLRAGIHANFWVLGTIGLAVDWSDATHFTAIGGVNLPNLKVGGVSCGVFGCYGLEAKFNGYAYLAVSSYNTTLSWGGQDHPVGAGVSFAASANFYLHACLAFCFGVHIGASIRFNPTKFCASKSGVEACIGFNPVGISVRKT
jgi:hypothetical protein